MSPIKLPSSRMGDLLGLSIRVSGWGKISDSKYLDLFDIYLKYINSKIKKNIFLYYYIIWSK